MDEPGDSGICNFCGRRISWHRALLDCSGQRSTPEPGWPAQPLVGLLAVFTSVMIYADTRRAWWALTSTAARFYGATVILGLTAVAAVLSPIAASEAAFRVAMALSIAARTIFFVWETLSSVRAVADPSSPIHRSEKTIRTLLPWFGRVRVTVFVLGTLVSVDGAHHERTGGNRCRRSGAGAFSARSCASSASDFLQL